MQFNSSTAPAPQKQGFKIKQLAQIQEALSVKGNLCYLQGANSSMPALFLAQHFVSKPHTTLVILPEKETAAYFLNDLQNLLPKFDPLFFPESFKMPYNPDMVDNANVLLRAEVLNKLNTPGNKPQIIVSYPNALSEQVVNKKTLVAHTLDVQVGQKYDTDFLLELLIEYGFERVDFVFEPGHFSIRGGIIDVFSFANELPYRIELFGKEVESIRVFDPETQLSTHSLSHLQILPNVQTRLLQETRESFIDYLPNNAQIWLKDPEVVLAGLDKAFEMATHQWEKLGVKTDELVLQLPPDALFETAHSFAAALMQKPLLVWGNIHPFQAKQVISCRCVPQPAIRKNFDLLISSLKNLEKEQYQLFFLSDGKKQQERLQTIFTDLGVSIPLQNLPFTLHEGFIDQDNYCAFFTDHQIFERYHKFKIKSYKQKSQAISLKELRELKPGDYVAHIDHGVGVFDGMEVLDVNGKSQEAVRLVYRDGDLLYVGINSLHKIAKFSQHETNTPKLNKLGSDAWEKLKAKTKNKVKDIAKDLIALYAKRKNAEGFAFLPDTYLQNELEASFMYEDTPDQQKATEAVKADMEKSYPMDRLICGDVGFGKTEIAVRAAFKAATDGKQVAVLVPTTILALQHFKTFSERLADFPVTVDYLNRFRSTKEQKEVFEKLSSGKIDIIIGTQKIVGKQVPYKDLGLLIIDEEQKFGVTAKEKLKELRVNIDTLTLTATPIPRTLQFSLMGARDLSVIHTPPPNRQPVQTTLITLNHDLIADAIHYELSRDGQVFFVHNRVSNIQEVANMIKKMVPEARVCVGHGQMKGDELEDVLLDFIDGKYDVLVATNIIESGLDISNANTIIINQAHMFGLSDLHQMRGRVGRSNRKAFCYLITPPLSVLTTDARKRLQALEDFSDLGSGFQIAMRDLDIRGAGNLLGAEQSGFISDIGFEMYHKILDEAISELKETTFQDLFADQPEQPLVRECQLDTDWEAHLPERYVSSSAERLSLYMELDNATIDEQLVAFEKRLIDRFGPLPVPAQNLLLTIKLRNLAKRSGIEKLTIKQTRMRAVLVNGTKESFYQGSIFSAILAYIQTNQDKSNMKQMGNTISWSVQGINSPNEAIILLQSLHN